MPYQVKLNFSLDSTEPLYLQIANQLRRAIASGQLKHGDALPSVRALAGELAFSEQVVISAYRLLTSDHLVEKRRGLGMFVSGDALGRASRMKMIAASVASLVSDARELRLSERDLRTLVQEAWETNPAGPQ